MVQHLTGDLGKEEGDITKSIERTCCLSETCKELGAIHDCRGMLLKRHLMLLRKVAKLDYSHYDCTATARFGQIVAHSACVASAGLPLGDPDVACEQVR